MESQSIKESGYAETSSQTPSAQSKNIKYVGATRGAHATQALALRERLRYASDIRVLLTPDF